MWNTGKAATRKDDAKPGQGNETLANGDRFEGEVKNGLRHGKATYFFVRAVETKSGSRAKRN